MTPQETIQAMKFYKEKLYNGIFNDKIGAFDVAISALEKQIPKKPLNCGLAFGCPTCESGINQEYGNPKYCDKCGQALDWGDGG